MSAKDRRFTAMALAASLAAVAPALPQTFDCAGISDVSDFDGPAVSDLDGLLTTVQVASGLHLALFAASPPGDVDRIFVVLQAGEVRIVRGGVVLPAPFLDIKTLVRSVDNGGDNEEGLLGMAFDPNYATNGLFYLYHTDITGDHNLVVRYTRDAANPDLADPATREVVLSISHPSFGNHNGGCLAFGPDGALYIGTGDGGADCDSFGNAQSLNTNLGKILRLQVDALPYSTAGNPFDGSIPGNDEIWAYGLRNPWRFAFDRATSNLYIADVGQNQREEIDCQPAAGTGGENYGWNRYEGSACPNPSCGSTGSCQFPNVLPIQEYTHSNPPGSCSIIGGYVYRGCRMSDLRGHYFYADLCSNVLRSFRTDASCAAPPPIDRTTDLTPEEGFTLIAVTSFGEDARGEILVVSRTGQLFKILPTLRIMEVSGENAPRFTLGIPDWTWEDLAATSSYPVVSYKVYRSSSPSGSYACAHQGPGRFWAGGDPEVPAPGAAFFYLVTAASAGGEEARPGNRSDGTPRSVDTTSICPL